MKIKQLSVFLENKPGALEKPVQLLAKAGYNLLTLTLADTQNFGILRLIVEDWTNAKTLLEESGFVVKVTELVVVDLPDKAGELAALLGLLRRARVNIEYMYGFTVAREGRGLLAFRFDDPDAALAALQAKGINPCSGVTLFGAPERGLRRGPQSRD
jgi:hypothetical protein